jgi:hypothetical protein
MFGCDQLFASADQMYWCSESGVTRRNGRARDFDHRSRSDQRDQLGFSSESTSPRPFVQVRRRCGQLRFPGDQHVGEPYAAAISGLLALSLARGERCHTYSRMGGALGLRVAGDLICDAEVT